MTTIEFPKSDSLIAFLCMCADVLNDNTFDENKVTVLELLIAQMQGTQIPPLDDYEDCEHKRLLSNVKNNPISSIKEVEDEIYCKMNNVSELAAAVGLFFANWEGKIPATNFPIMQSLYIEDENIQRLASIARNREMVLTQINKLLSKLETPTGLTAPDIYKIDLVAEALKTLTATSDTPETEDNGELQRTINSERLELYFKSTFKGRGNCAVNYFTMLIDSLEIERNAKQYAQIALMIYQSEVLNDKKPSTFRHWYSVFCECVGCEKKTYDNTKKLEKETPLQLRRLFNYLIKVV